MTKIILGLAGEMASGKGTAADYLMKKKKSSSHRFSTMLRDVLTRLHLEHTRENLQHLSTIIRKTYGEDTLARVMAEDVKRDNAHIVVVDGVRRLDDIVYLKELEGFKLVYIDADIRKRYDRIIARNENVDDQGKSFEQFEEESKDESEVQIGILKNYADVIIDNNGDLAQLHEQIDALLTDAQ